MGASFGMLQLAIVAFLYLAAPWALADQDQDLVDNPFPEAQAELKQAVESIARDAMSAHIDGLQQMHLQHDKFSKFGPRNFDRQDVSSTNASEAEFFSSISEVDYRVNDLKVDVFGAVGVVTYYPQVSFVKDGEPKQVNGRQTLVFLKTDLGWKIVHEHGTVRP